MFHLNGFEDEAERARVRSWLINVDEMVSSLPHAMAAPMLELLRGADPFLLQRSDSAWSPPEDGIVRLDPVRGGAAALMHGLVLMAGGSTLDARVLENLAYGRAQGASAPSDDELAGFALEDFRGAFVYRNLADGWVYSVSGRVRLMPWSQLESGRPNTGSYPVLHARM